MKIVGLDKLEKKLERLQYLRWVKQGMLLAGDTIISKAGEYPMENEGNIPNARGRWYDRGYGERSLSGWSRATSEQLGPKWYRRLTKKWAVAIGNPVSYARFVHGAKQAAFHGRRGWRKLEDTAKKLIPKIIQEFQRRVDRELRR